MLHAPRACKLTVTEAVGRDREVLFLIMMLMLVTQTSQGALVMVQREKAAVATPVTVAVAVAMVKRVIRVMRENMFKPGREDAVKSQQW